MDHAGLRTQRRKTSDKRGSRPRTDVWDLVQHVGHVVLPRGARCGKAARRDLRGGREVIPSLPQHQGSPGDEGMTRDGQDRTVESDDEGALSRPRRPCRTRLDELASRVSCQ